MICDIIRYSKPVGEHHGRPRGKPTPTFLVADNIYYVTLPTLKVFSIELKEEHLLRNPSNLESSFDVN